MALSFVSVPAAQTVAPTPVLRGALAEPRAEAAAGSGFSTAACSLVAAAGVVGVAANRRRNAKAATATRRGPVAVRARGGDDDDDDDYEYVGMSDVNFATMKVGQEVIGTVVKIMPFGAFVDVGEMSGTQGLVPTSKLSDERVEEPSDVVKEGDVVQAWVSAKDIDDQGRKKLTLSMSKNKIFTAPRSTVPVSEFENADEKTWYDGTVVGIQSFGAFVAIPHPNGGEGTCQGLVPVSQIQEERVEDVFSAVQMQQKVKVRVVEVNVAANRMSLSMRQPPKPRVPTANFANFDDAKWVDATVVNVVDFGAFVALKDPLGSEGEAQGLIPIVEMSEKRVNAASDVVTAGQEVKVRIISVDAGADRMTLSLRARPVPLTEFMGIDKDTWIEATVLNIAPFGAFVAVKDPQGGEGVAQALCPISEIADDRVSAVEEVVSEGETIKVRVLDVNPEEGRMTVTKKDPNYVSPMAKAIEELSEVGDDVWFEGKVVNMTNFGAFVEVKAPATGAQCQGLVHISQIAETQVDDPAEHLEMDQEVKVRVIEVKDGKVNLSMRSPMAEAFEQKEEEAA